MNKEEKLKQIVEDLPHKSMMVHMTKKEWYGWFEEVYDHALKQVNNSGVLGSVVQQRELLLAYEKTTQTWEFDEFDEYSTNKKVNDYLDNK